MIFNHPSVHRAQLPAVNGITTARALARIYARLMGDVDEEDGTVLPRLLSDSTRAQATLNITPEGEPDQNWYNLPSTFSQGGFQTFGTCFNILGEGVFGHCGKSILFSLILRSFSFVRIRWQLCICLSSATISLRLRVQLFRSFRSGNRYPESPSS